MQSKANQFHVVLEKGDRVKLTIPDQKLHNITAFKEYLVSKNLVDKEYFSLAYESKEYMSYIVISKDEELKEWIECGMPDIHIEGSVVDEIVGKLGSLFKNAFKKSGNSRKEERYSLLSDAEDF